MIKVSTVLVQRVNVSIKVVRVHSVCEYIKEVMSEKVRYFLANMGVCYIYCEKRKYQHYRENGQLD